MQPTVCRNSFIIYRMLVIRITTIMSIYVFTVINRKVIGSYYIPCFIQLGHLMNGRVHVNAVQTTLICSINKEYHLPVLLLACSRGHQSGN